MDQPSPFIPVGALADAFASENNCLPRSAALSGRSLQLQFEDGSSIDLNFLDADGLAWKTTQNAGHAQYLATEPRPGVFFVDYVDTPGKPHCTSLVLDLAQNIVTCISGTLPTQGDTAIPVLQLIAQGLELTRVEAVVRHGAIGHPCSAATPRHAPTRELIGRRVRYTYSPTELYEHIYLNDHFYCWQCLKGAERGLADTDRCHYYKLADRLYLFIWREKIVPTLGIVVVDLEQLRTTGKIFGYQGEHFHALSNFPVGAIAREIQAVPRHD